MPGIRLNTRDWSVQRTTLGGGKGRRSATAAVDFPPEFLTDESVVAEAFDAQPSTTARRGAAAPGALDFSYDLGDGESAILAIRHPSGALTFHLPVESTRRGAAKKGEVRFVVSVRSVDTDTGRRGLISKAIKAILIKVGEVVVDKAVSFVLPKLVRAFETSTFEKKGLAEGWFKVTKNASALALESGAPTSTDRTLLLLHGTFSDAAGAYGGLASSTFFDRVAPLYGDRIYAFNHFTLSRTPEENSRMLLDGLGDKAFLFDVITHSRGGLVLRTLVERSSALGAPAKRFSVGRAVLVASPNEGTPLATPARWHDTVGWIANLLELFPDNPFTIGAEFVANALVWLARHASGDLPGLHAMDRDGNVIGDLQGPPGPPADVYSALVANYTPAGNVLQRLIDTGVDQFFGMANDLVVPSQGGWQIDRAGVAAIPPSRIGCFGPGGNLSQDAVTHVNFFPHPETVDFLVTALAGQSQPLAAVDASKSLPDRRMLRSAGVATRSGAGRTDIPGVPVAPRAAPGEVTGSVQLAGTAVESSDTFHLVVLPASESDKHRAQMLAHYGSARVIEDFRLGGSDTDAGKRWQTIIQHNRAIRNYIDNGAGQMPSQEELRDFGKVLFETLFPGTVRRLYDTARSIQRSDRLNVILTSTVPWVADNPWEFAYDPVRRTSLATEELHFIRNVMTAVPAEVIDDRERLRILVASSQPVGLGKLSIDQEKAVIARGFEPLREAGLADVEVLARATPASLHGYISTGQFSIVHFIGHGEYDAAKDKGFLIFQDDLGNPYPVDDRSAREILCGRGIRLVFLNACETGQGGRADFNSGIAPALVAGGVPIVVANQYKVLDTSATLFAQHFYWALAQGMAVGEAARESRIAVNYSLSGEAIDWAVPVVYARDPKSRLAPRQAPDFRLIPSPAVRASGRRSVAQHTIRVAVWDTHSQFPGLRATLERMNSVQSFYGFEIVDLSVPIDAWHVHNGTKYLDADRFAERLAPQISQLGVHFISAIVDAWLAYGIGTEDETYKAYGWWSGKDQPPVLVFSTKDLGLEPTGPETDRAIANVAVAGIAGYLTDRDSHPKGPTDCPSYYNPKRSLSVLTGRQRFCKVCSKELRKLHPRELEAMNAILRAFD